MINIVLPISRTDYLKPVFDCLNALERPADTELLIITDGDKTLERAVDKRLESINYKRIQVISFGDTPAENINDRRYRISAIHNKAKNFISKNSDYILTIEDDMAYPKNTLTKLQAIFDNNDTARFAQGVALGRHNTPYVGAWAADNIDEPTKITSLMPLQQKPLEIISAGGLYCALIDANEYRNHTFEPYDKFGKNGLSCDVNMGISIRQKGFLCYMDWSIQCDHIGDKGSVNLGNTKPVQLVFNKTDSWRCERV